VGLFLGLIGLVIVAVIPASASRQPVIPPPAYDTAGWDQVLVDAGQLSLERQAWIRTDLARRQQTGQLMAAVVGTRERPLHDGEPAALLIYPNVIVATSGYGTGVNSYLRPGGSHLFDAVVGDQGLLECTTSTDFHIVDLGPAHQTSVAIGALRSLPWIQLRELHLDPGA
jgi:hypothetical protein